MGKVIKKRVKTPTLTQTIQFILYIFLIFLFELDGEYILPVNVSTNIDNFYQKASRCGLSLKYPNNSSGLFNVQFLLLKIPPLRR
jgi:hypothetical protein